MRSTATRYVWVSQVFACKVVANTVERNEFFASKRVNVLVVNGLFTFAFKDPQTVAADVSRR